MQKEINVILGEQVKKARWENNITREKLAEKIDVSPRFLADVESGKIGVSIQTLKQLSLALGKSTDSLLGLTPPTESELAPILNLLYVVDEKYRPLLLSLLQGLRDLP